MSRFAETDHTFHWQASNKECPSATTPGEIHKVTDTKQRKNMEKNRCWIMDPWQKMMIFFGHDDFKRLQKQVDWIGHPHFGGISDTILPI